MVKILPPEIFWLIYARKRCFKMGDVRYVKMLKQPPTSQIRHFHTATRRDLLAMNVSKARKGQSKTQENAAQICCNTGSCCPFEATVVSNWFRFSFQILHYISGLRKLYQKAVTEHYGHILSFISMLGLTSCPEVTRMHALKLHN